MAWKPGLNRWVPQSSWRYGFLSPTIRLESLDCAEPVAVLMSVALCDPRVEILWSGSLLDGYRNTK